MILSSQKIPSVSLTRNLNSSEFQTDLFPQNEKAVNKYYFFILIERTKYRTKMNYFTK